MSLFETILRQVPDEQIPVSPGQVFRYVTGDHSVSRSRPIFRRRRTYLVTTSKSIQLSLKNFSLRGIDGISWVFGGTLTVMCPPDDARIDRIVQELGAPSLGPEVLIDRIVQEAVSSRETQLAGAKQDPVMDLRRDRRRWQEQIESDLSGKTGLIVKVELRSADESTTELSARIVIEPMQVSVSDSSERLTWSCVAELTPPDDGYGMLLPETQHEQVRNAIRKRIKSCFETEVALQQFVYDQPSLAVKLEQVVAEFVQQQYRQRARLFEQKFRYEFPVPQFKTLQFSHTCRVNGLSEPVTVNHDLHVDVENIALTRRMDQATVEQSLKKLIQEESQRLLFTSSYQKVISEFEHGLAKTIRDQITEAAKAWGLRIVHYSQVASTPGKSDPIRKGIKIEMEDDYRLADTDDPARVVVSFQAQLPRQTDGTFEPAALERLARHFDRANVDFAEGILKPAVRHAIQSVLGRTKAIGYYFPTAGSARDGRPVSASENSDRRTTQDEVVDAIRSLLKDDYGYDCLSVNVQLSGKIIRRIRELQTGDLDPLRIVRLQITACDADTPWDFTLKYRISGPSTAYFLRLLDQNYSTTEKELAAIGSCIESVVIQQLDHMMPVQALVNGNLAAVRHAMMKPIQDQVAEEHGLEIVLTSIFWNNATLKESRNQNITALTTELKMVNHLIEEIRNQILKRLTADGGDSVDDLKENEQLFMARAEELRRLMAAVSGQGHVTGPVLSDVGSSMLANIAQTIQILAEQKANIGHNAPQLPKIEGSSDKTEGPHGPSASGQEGAPS